MAADNTSAFNCRPITGGSGFSVHSWGMAIDINPVENPYIRGGVVLPPASESYLDRQDVRPGMIVDGDLVVEAFATIGFSWGGDWERLKDYQHFEIADPAAAVLEGSPIGGDSDADANGAVEPCSVPVSAADAWPGSDDLIDPASGQLDPASFNEFLRTAGPPISTSPCDATRVLLRLDRPRDEGETVRIVVEPDGAAGTTVTVTNEHLADDSVTAVRFVLQFLTHPDGTIELAFGTWSQRCQPGRGHDDFSAELCV